MKCDLRELDKLEAYLKEKNIPHERKRRYSPELDAEFEKLPYGGWDGGEQIIVYDEKLNRQWDAIIGYGSYGVSEGLLEVYGCPVVLDSDGDSVCGGLTAADVIQRLDTNR